VPRGTSARRNMYALTASRGAVGSTLGRPRRAAWLRGNRRGTPGTTSRLTPDPTTVFRQSDRQWPPRRSRLPALRTRRPGTRPPSPATPPAGAGLQGPHRRAHARPGRRRQPVRRAAMPVALPHDRPFHPARQPIPRRGDQPLRTRTQIDRALRLPDIETVGLEADADPLQGRDRGLQLFEHARHGRSPPRGQTTWESTVTLSNTCSGCNPQFQS
jgi:hypothetical protein